MFHWSYPGAEYPCHRDKWSAWSGQPYQLHWHQVGIKRTLRWPRKCWSNLISLKARLAKIFLLKTLVTFLIATPSPVWMFVAALDSEIGDRRQNMVIKTAFHYIHLRKSSTLDRPELMERRVHKSWWWSITYQTIPYAPWPNSLVTLYRSSTIKSWLKTLKILRPRRSAMVLEGRWKNK